MNGVIAFVNGLHWILNYLIASAVLAAGGLAVMALSAVFRYSKRHDAVKSFIFMVIGTVLLIPAIIVGVIFSIGYILNIIASNIIVSAGVIQWHLILLAILGIALPVFIIVYDIKVIINFICEKKMKTRDQYKTEEQKNG